MSYRIGIDARFYRSGTGGLGRYIRNLINELAKIDQENEYTVILTPADEAEYSSPGKNFQPLVVDIPHYSPAEQRAFLKVLNQQNFDLIHFGQFNHPILYRRPFVVTVHDIIMHLFPGTVQQRSWLHRFGYRVVFNDCKRAKRVIVPSQSTKNDIVDKLGFPADRVVITVQGSEQGFVPHTAAQAKAIKEKYRLPEQFLIFVSRWEPYKGIPVLLPAFEALVKDYPELGLVICGKPDPQHPDVTSQVKAAQTRHPNIVTPGFISDDDLKALYSAATVYVHPSQYEGFGIMILEAFASGVPVVTSNTSSLPEVAGDAALLVDPLDASDVAAKVRQILDDPKLADQLRQRGLDRVKKYSWAKMATETLKVYQDVLKNPRLG